LYILFKTEVLHMNLNEGGSRMVVQQSPALGGGGTGEGRRRKEMTAAKEQRRRGFGRWGEWGRNSTVQLYL
jgi:hypothetical protein